MIKIFNKSIPHCDKLFKKYFRPWYLEDNPPLKTRPDFYTISAYENEPLNMEEVQYLDQKTMEFVLDIFHKMRSAYKQDFQIHAEFGVINIDVIEKFDDFYTKAIIRDLINKSAPKKFDNPYLVTVCELGLALGDLFVNTTKFRWLYSFPYFHSIVVNPQTGIGITVFDWALKRLSSYGMNDRLKGKYDITIEIIDDKIKTLTDKI
ncbi:MAG: hypothetical protein MI922_18955 [Bacteroidales bacterium]|nr:hypothetical protein [Bacteroidales bacterium]